MVKYNELNKSKFFKRFPNICVYWCVIDNARETLDDVPKHLFVIPTHVRCAKILLKGLKQQKNEGFYKGYEDCEELKEMQEALEDLIERLMKLALKLKINVKDHIVVGDMKWEFENCPIDQIQLGLYDSRTADDHLT